MAFYFRLRSGKRSHSQSVNVPRYAKDIVKKPDYDIAEVDSVAEKDVIRTMAYSYLDFFIVQ